MTSTKTESNDLATRISDVLVTRSGEIVQRLVATYRHNPGYAALDPSAVERDLLPVAAANERLLIQSLRRVEHDAADIAVIAESAVRRFAQGVPQAEVMRAYRLWSMAIWTEITEIAHGVDGVDADDLVKLAAAILEHNEYAGGLAADAYDAEEHGIWMEPAPLRGPLVERLLAGEAAPADVEGLVERCFGGAAPAAPTVLVAAPRTGSATTSQQNSAVRRIVSAWREATADRTVVAVDGRMAILIGTVAGAAEWRPQLGTHDAEAIVMAIQPGTDGIEDAFLRCAELREIIAVAQLLPPQDAPLRWQDALLGSLVRGAPQPIKERLLDSHRKLTEYEERHATPLLETLDALFALQLNVSATAQSLFCHPNTIRYRLQRVQALTGLDPIREQDRLILRLALTLGNLSAPERPAASA